MSIENVQWLSIWSFFIKSESCELRTQVIHPPSKLLVRGLVYFLIRRLTLIEALALNPAVSARWVKTAKPFGSPHLPRRLVGETVSVAGFCSVAAGLTTALPVSLATMNSLRHGFQCKSRLSKV